MNVEPEDVHRSWNEDQAKNARREVFRERDKRQGLVSQELPQVADLVKSFEREEAVSCFAMSLSLQRYRARRAQLPLTVYAPTKKTTKRPTHLLLIAHPSITPHATRFAHHGKEKGLCKAFRWAVIVRWSASGAEEWTVHEAKAAERCITGAVDSQTQN